MARLPFERINVTPQFNRLSAPNVPNAPQPVNLSNAGINAQYQSLTAFANSLNSLGAAFAQRAAQEKNEEDRLQAIDLGNDLDEATKLIELRFKSEPPKDTEDAINSLDNFLYGQATPESLKKLSENKIQYTDLKRQGGLLSALQEKYGNKRVLNQYIEQFEIRQHFLARGLAIQNVHNANTAQVKKNLLQYSSDLLNQDISEMSPESLITSGLDPIQQKNMQNDTPSLLMNYSPEQFRQKILEDIESNFESMIIGLNPVHQQNLKSELMPAMMKLADEKQRQFEVYERGVKINDFNEYALALQQNPLYTISEKLADFEKRVSEGINEGFLDQEKEIDTIAGYQKALEEDLAAKSIALDPASVLASIDKGFEKGSRKGHTIEVNGQVEDFELSSFTAKELFTLRGKAQKQLAKGITEAQRRAKSQINLLIGGASTFDKVQYSDKVLYSELETLIEILDDGSEGAKQDAIAYRAGLEAQLAAREVISEIPNMNKVELDSQLMRDKPMPKLEDGSFNPFYSSEMTAYNAVNKAIQSYKEERNSNGASFYLSSKFGDASNKEIEFKVVNFENIIESFVEQQGFFGDTTANTTIRAGLKNLDNGKIYNLLDSPRIHLLDKEYRNQFDNYYQSISNSGQMIDFMMQIEAESGDLASVVFRELAKDKADGGIGFNPAYFLMTEVGNEEHQNIIFNSIRDQKYLNKPENLAALITDSFSPSEVRTEILNEPIFQDMINSYVITGPAMNSTKEMLTDSMINLVLYHASMRATSEKGTLKDSINTTKAMLESQFINIESTRVSDNPVYQFFADAPVQIMIPRKKLSNVIGKNPDTVSNALTSFVEATGNTDLIESNFRWARSPDDQGLILMTMNPDTFQYNIVKDEFNKDYVLTYSQLDEIVAAELAQNPPTTLIEDLNNVYMTFATATPADLIYIDTDKIIDEKGRLEYSGILDYVGEVVGKGNTSYPNPVVRIAAELLLERGHFLEQIKQSDELIFDALHEALDEASKRAAEAASKDAKKDQPIRTKGEESVEEPVAEPVAEPTAIAPEPTVQENIVEQAKVESEQRIDKIEADTPTSNFTTLFDPKSNDPDAIKRISEEKWVSDSKDGQYIERMIGTLNEEIDETILNLMDNNNVIVEVENLVEQKSVLNSLKYNLISIAPYVGTAGFDKEAKILIDEINSIKLKVNEKRKIIYQKLVSKDAGKRVQDRLGDILN
jgi:hypothetical protein